MFQIQSIVVTLFQQNCRLLVCPESLKAVVVDPGGESEKILSVLKEKKLTCEQIWLTHSHVDHCGGVAILKAATNAQLFAHPIEKNMRAKVREICSMFGVPPEDMQPCPEPEHYISGGELLEFSKWKFKVIFTPGHSPGHVCFYEPVSGTLLAGDTVFAGSIGRTDLPGGNHETLLKSIRENILTLPALTKILSGHGPDTSVQIEKETNPFF